ncbi:hypothetical protein [Streptomyces sp. NPDC090445]|uniref:hypothetical protein n=1 Tax=Streptomyces sp. NPDC090445 TaxID=3365963 RepID=UPI0037F80B6D
MSRTSRTLRLALFTASASLAAGGALLPTSALAAPATPHTVTLPADRGANGQENDEREDRTEDTTEDTTEDRTGETDGTDQQDPAEGADQPGSTDSESGVVPESYCNDPKGLPGLCVDGKPLPKGDGTVTVPQGSVLCLGIDTPQQCADRQRPVVQSPTGSSTVELAV